MAAGLGLSVLLVASEVAYQALRVVGVAVLLWYLVIAALVTRALGWLRRPVVRRRLERISGGVLIALGIRLDLSR